jgi:hypothetical protein
MNTKLQTQKQIIAGIVFFANLLLSLAIFMWLAIEFGSEERPPLEVIIFAAAYTWGGSGYGLGFVLLWAMRIEMRITNGKSAFRWWCILIFNLIASAFWILAGIAFGPFGLLWTVPMVVISSWNLLLLARLHRLHHPHNSARLQ